MLDVLRNAIESVGSAQRVLRDACSNLSHFGKQSRADESGIGDTCKVMCQSACDRVVCLREIRGLRHQNFLDNGDVDQPAAADLVLHRHFVGLLAGQAFALRAWRLSVIDYPRDGGGDVDRNFRALTTAALRRHSGVHPVRHGRRRDIAEFCELAARHPVAAARHVSVVSNFSAHASENIGVPITRESIPPEGPVNRLLAPSFDVTDDPRMTKPAAWFLQLVGLIALILGIANASTPLIVISIALIVLGGWGIRKRIKS